MLEIAYVAGLFDGEGWVRIDNHIPKGRTARFMVSAGIAMTHRPVIEALHAQFGGWSVGDDCFRRKYERNRTIYRWYVGSLSAEKFLTLVLPHLFVKRDQAELALELQRDIRENKSRMIGRNADEAFKLAVYARRKALADKCTALKKVNYDLPVGSDPMRAA